MWYNVIWQFIWKPVMEEIFVSFPEEKVMTLHSKLDLNESEPLLAVY